jgi:phytoene synthase
MTQVMAALPRDASRRQLVVPLQVLQQHGSGMEEVFAGRQTARLRAVLHQLVGDAQGHLKTAFALLATVPPQVRPVFLPLKLVASELMRMSRADSDPFAPHVPSRLWTLWTLWRASRSREFRGGG